MNQLIIVLRESIKILNEAENALNENHIELAKLCITGLRKTMMSLLKSKEKE